MDVDPLVKIEVNELCILPLVVAGRCWRVEIVELFVRSGFGIFGVVVSR